MIEDTAHTVAEGEWIFANALIAKRDPRLFTIKATRVVRAADRLRILGVVTRLSI
jgi:hypothetical protein